jgi:hypothetical protein
MDSGISMIPALFLDFDVAGRTRGQVIGTSKSPHEMRRARVVYAAHCTCFRPAW